jgi:hypothetical protein
MEAAPSLSIRNHISPAAASHERKNRNYKFRKQQLRVSERGLIVIKVVSFALNENLHLAEAKFVF